MESLKAILESNNIPVQELNDKKQLFGMVAQMISTILVLDASTVPSSDHPREASIEEASIDKVPISTKVVASRFEPVPDFSITDQEWKNLVDSYVRNDECNN